MTRKLVRAAAVFLGLLALACLVATIWLATAATWSDGLLSQRLAMTATGTGFLIILFGMGSAVLWELAS